ncbi:hypothetical protein [Polyangium aurulentum]|uniref:hypothetical protein n=1 Tax=Polyangium aurulentum TaxID=2567896 RepID=UPI0010ADD389|nr:hypothetical protein [Polyangium aurulentum]UQA55290.1 hypothetical protein E8A73_028555 [Polyangium aurulentum]
MAIGIGFLGARSASGDPAEDDGAPSGMVAFVQGGQCPVGWEPALLVEGRLVVGVDDGANVGVEVGEPLGDREDRAHAHAFSGELTLASKNIAAADGSNMTGAAAKAYPVAGTTAEETSGLPFVQVKACVKP